jgi:hypothetical protein
MGISRAREVNFTTGLPLLQEKKFNRAQTHRWHSGKYSYRSAFLLYRKVLLRGTLDIKMAHVEAGITNRQ